MTLRPDLEIGEKESNNNSIPSDSGSHDNNHKLRQGRTHPWAFPFSVVRYWLCHLNRRNRSSPLQWIICEHSATSLQTKNKLCRYKDFSKRVCEMEQCKYKHLQRVKKQGLPFSSFMAILNSTHPMGLLDTGQMCDYLLHTCPILSSPIPVPNKEEVSPHPMHTATSPSPRLGTLSSHLLCSISH